MAAKILPDAEVLRQLFNYDPETGAFAHRERPLSMFKSARYHKAWNTHHAGNSTGCLSACGYVQVVINREKFLAHRVAWKMHYGTEPSEVLDHINNNPSDNRISNLRPATQSQNVINSRLPKNETGVRGVYLEKRRGFYIVTIRANKKRIHIGIFRTIEEATQARRDAAIKYHGEFARTA